MNFRTIIFQQITKRILVEIVMSCGRPAGSWAIPIARGVGIGTRKLIIIIIYLDHYYSLSLLLTHASSFKNTDPVFIFWAERWSEALSDICLLNQIFAASTDMG